jgi:hypothetical protein
MATEDVKAIAEDAHRLGMRVAAQAVDKANIQVAIDAGWIRSSTLFKLAMPSCKR